MARVMSTIVTNAGVPSCIRVPPDAVAAIRGRPAAVARRTASVIRRPAARPTEPPRKPNSLTISATPCPWMLARPVMTDSSVPALSRARSIAAR